MRWIWYVLAVLWLLDALRMRRRLRSIPVLTPATGTDVDGYAFVSAPGVEIDGHTRAAAAAYARRHDVALLDVIPFDTPSLVAMGVVQLVDPESYRTDPIARGHSTGYALMIERTLLARAGLDPAEECDTVALIRTAKDLKPYAAKRAAVAMAPGLRASDMNLTTNWPVFAATIGTTCHAWFLARALLVALLVAGPIAAPVAGTAALAALHLQPIVVFAGTAFRPRDWIRTVLLRSVLEAWTWLLTLVSRFTAAEDRRALMAARRQLYARLLKDGTDRFFEPRRSSCPVCESDRLRQRLRTIDLVQHKPGEFILDECQACGHIFQNPRLSAVGLEFYYADFYEGLRTPVAETISRTPMRLYLDRARAIAGLAKPKRWLDVGTAHGHFCRAAREAWPATAFDGLDIGQGVEEARRAGWIERGYRGSFPQIADEIAGQYDVVSLFHCLEHTPEPRAELAAAYKTLEPGGLLVIEVPDPECRTKRLLGRFWFPWFQPQHLHLLSVRNLTRLLEKEGFTPAVIQRRESHIQTDFFAFLIMLYTSIAPRPDMPWLPPSSRAQRAWYQFVWNAGLPLIPIAIALDVLCAPLARRAGLSNAYRVVARRDGRPLQRQPSAVETHLAVDEQTVGVA